MTIQWSERALTQIREIIEYVARDHPDAAEHLLVGLLERVNLLIELPEQDRVWDDGQRPDLREILHESHRIVYRVRAEEISILSVRHTRMLPDDSA